MSYSALKLASFKTLIYNVFKLSSRGRSPVVNVDGAFLLCWRQGLVVGVHADCQRKRRSCHAVRIECLHTHETCSPVHKQDSSVCMPVETRVAESYGLAVFTA